MPTKGCAIIATAAGCTYTTNAEYSVQMDLIERIADGKARKFVTDKSTWEITIRGLYDGGAGLVAACKNGTPVNATFSSAGNVTSGGNAYIVSCRESAPKDGLATYDVTIRGGADEDVPDAAAQRRAPERNDVNSGNIDESSWLEKEPED